MTEIQFDNRLNSKQVNVTPEAVNQDAYGDGWLIKLKPSSSDALADLMDVDAYREFVESE